MSGNGHWPITVFDLHALAIDHRAVRLVGVALTLVGFASALVAHNSTHPAFPRSGHLNLTSKPVKPHFFPCELTSRIRGSAAS
jgi:hypothetical protein